MNTPFKKIAAAIEVPDIESVDGGVYLSNEQMAAIESKLEATELTAQVEQLQSQLQQAAEKAAEQDAKLTEKDTELATAATEITKLKDEVVKLKNLPADDTEVVITGGGVKKKPATKAELEEKAFK